MSIIIDENGSEGSGGVHAAIKDRTDAAKGIEVQIAEDATWSLKAIERNPNPIPAEAVISTDDDANYLQVTLPADLHSGFGEDGNDWVLRVERGVSPVEGVDPIQAFARARTTNTANYTQFTLPEDLPDALTTEGDLWDMRLRRGRPAHAASAMVAAMAATRANGRWHSGGGTSGPGIRFTFDGNDSSTVGLAGNNWTYGTGANGSSSVITITANEISDSLSITVGLNGTTLSDVYDAFDAFNVGGVSFSVEYINSADGTESLSGVGTLLPVNFTGGAAATDAIAAGADAYADWENGAGNGIRITMAGHLPSALGADGNQWEIYTNENLSVSEVAFTVNYTTHRIDFTFNTTSASMTLGDVKDAFDAFNEGELSFTTEYTGTGATGLNLSGFPHAVLTDFEGGAGTPARARQPIHGRIDTTNNRLVITYRDGDTQTDVRTAVALATYLDDFSVEQTWGTANITIVGTAGLDFGTLHDSSIPDAGDIVDFSFSGAADAVIEVLRTPLTVPGAASAARLISIIAIATDTNADIVAAAATAAYSDLDGVSQVWPADSMVAVGDGTTPIGDGTNIFNRPVGNHKNFAFAGGQNPEPITAEIFKDRLELEVKYVASHDTLTEILEVIETTEVTPVLIHGTDGDAFPEDSPFERAFRGAGAAGGGGGGGGGSSTAAVTKTAPNFFKAPIDEFTGVDLTQSAANYLAITAANVITDRGAAFEVGAGTNALQHVKCLKAGNYSILIGVAIGASTSGNFRSNIVSKIDVQRAGVAVAGTEFEQGIYSRNAVPVGSFTMALMVDLEVDDLIEMLLHREVDNSSTHTIGGSDSFISIVENVGTPTVAIDGGGGGGAPGWIEPKDEYVADDLGKFLLENGILKHIVLEAHAGHSRVVEFQTLANAVSALDADGNNITTGGAGNFLGFFPNLSGIPALSISDEVWVALIGAGDFEIQDPTGFYASEHWNSYNPFNGSGARPWATITKADGTTQNHVAFTDPDTGIISDFRVVNITQHAERYTTAIGEAFFIQDEQKIKMVTAYTPHEEGEVQYVSEPYYAPGTNRPLVRFWGVGQTSAENGAIPVAHNSTALVGTNSYAYRYQFKGTSPDELIIGNIPTDLKFLAAADVSTGYFQLITVGTADEAALLDYQILQLPPGTWRLNFFASHRETADTVVAAWLYEAMGTSDDTVKAHRALAYASVQDDPLGAIDDDDQLGMNVEFNDIIITNTDVKYLTFITAGFGDNTTSIDGICHLTMEKLL